MSRRKIPRQGGYLSDLYPYFLNRTSVNRTEKITAIEAAEEMLKIIRPIDRDALRWLFLSTQPGQLGHFVPEVPEIFRKRLRNDKKITYSKPHKYAVFVNGYPGLENGFSDDIYLAYKTSLDEGFRPKDIYILSNSVRAGISYPTDGPATQESFDLLINHLSRKISKQDLLFFYFTGHGGMQKFKNPETGLVESCASLSLYGKDVSDKEIVQKLESLTPKIGVYLTDTCYSGNFAEKLGRGNNIAISSSSPYNLSQGNFTDEFFGAFEYKMGDLDGDGRVSIGEAFNYAITNDYFTQHNIVTPQIYSEEINPYTVYLDI
jgi:hypothetical protein